jgi:hypothetical protein
MFTQTNGLNHISVAGFPDIRLIKSQGQGKIEKTTLFTATTVALQAGDQITACFWGQFVCPATDDDVEADPDAHRYCRFGGFLLAQLPVN